MNGRVGPLVVVGKTGDLKEVLLKHLLAITIALLPSAALAEQFTPQQMLDVMTKSPSNRDVRVQDITCHPPNPGKGIPQCSPNKHIIIMINQ